MKKNMLTNVALFAAGIGIGYFIFKPAEAAATPPAEGTAAGQRYVRVGAKAGNCQCANGTICTGLSDCRCCDGKGGNAIVYTGQRTYAALG